MKGLMTLEDMDEFAYKLSSMIPEMPENVSIEIELNKNEYKNLLDSMYFSTISSDEIKNLTINTPFGIKLKITLKEK